MLLSCTRQETEEVTPAQTFKTIEFNVATPGTKAIFGEKSGSTYPVSWTANDVAPAITYNKVADINQVSDFTQTGTSARFTWEVPEGADSYYFNLVSPFGALKTFYNGNRINVEIPSGQTCTAGSPDENAIILYARTPEYAAAELPSSLNVTFNHVPAYMRLIFSNLDKVSDAEVVQSVVIESADLNIAGRIFFYTDDGTWAENSGAMVKAVTVSTSQLDNVWVALAPVDLSGKTLSFIVNTDKNTYTKEITFPAGRALTSGRTAKFTVDMTGAEVAEIVEYELVTSTSDLHYGDEIIIAAADSDVAISTSQKDNNRSATGVTREGTKIIGASSAVEIIRLGDGLIPGTWSLNATRGVSDGYLYAAGNVTDGGNWLRTKADLDALGSWSITFGDLTEADSNSPDATRAIIRAQTGGNSRCIIRYYQSGNIFSAYNTTTTCNPVKIYRKVKDPVVENRFNVLDASGSLDPVSVDYTEQTVSLYVMGNVSWTATVTGGATFTSSSSASTSGTGATVLTVSVPENTSSVEKNYVVTVSTSASVTTNSYQLSIEQDAHILPQVDDVLFFENWAGAADGSTDGALSKYLFGGTTVFDDGSVVYTGNAYTKTDANANCKEASGRDETLLIPSNGTWTISGIPCEGVATATLSYVINRSQTGKYVPSSTTDGVSIGAETQTSTSANGNTYYTLSFPVTFDSSKDIKTFDLTITNTHTANTRFTLINVVVNSTTGAPAGVSYYHGGTYGD